MAPDESRVSAIIECSRFQQKPCLADAGLAEQDGGWWSALGERPDDIGASNHRGH
jgi:hypothetical protein